MTLILMHNRYIYQFGGIIEGHSYHGAQKEDLISRLDTEKIG